MDPTIIDWQGTCILPRYVQYHIPEAIKYEPRLFLESGEPMFVINAVEDVPLPSYFDKMTLEQKEIVEGELRLVTRQIRYMQMIKKVPYLGSLMFHPLAPFVSNLLIGVLRSCADGPFGLRSLLYGIIDGWQEDLWGPCPIAFASEEHARHMEEMKRYERYTYALIRLQARVGCAVDGLIHDIERYDQAKHEMEAAKKEWDVAACGPFPFEDGMSAQFLR